MATVSTTAQATTPTVVTLSSSSAASPSEDIWMTVGLAGVSGNFLQVLYPCGGGYTDWLDETGLGVGLRKDLLDGRFLAVS